MKAPVNARRAICFASSIGHPLNMPAEYTKPAPYRTMPLVPRFVPKIGLETGADHPHLQGAQQRPAPLSFNAPIEIDSCRRSDSRPSGAERGGEGFPRL